MFWTMEVFIAIHLVFTRPKRIAVPLSELTAQVKDQKDLLSDSSSLGLFAHNISGRN